MRKKVGQKWGENGEFLSTKRVQNIDYQHFNKNTTIISPPGEFLKKELKTGPRLQRVQRLFMQRLLQCQSCFLLPAFYFTY